jgi:hypothetical protein
VAESTSGENVMMNPEVENAFKVVTYSNIIPIGHGSIPKINFTGPDNLPP